MPAAKKPSPKVIPDPDEPKIRNPAARKPPEPPRPKSKEKFGGTHVKSRLTFVSVYLDPHDPTGGPAGDDDAEARMADTIELEHLPGADFQPLGVTFMGGGNKRYLVQFLMIEPLPEDDS